MRIFLLALALVIVGCGPVSQYNVKMQKINTLHDRLEKDDSMADIQKEIFYWSEVKKEFPEHKDGVDNLLSMAKEGQAKIDKGTARLESIAQQFNADTKMSGQERNELVISSMRKEFPEYKAEMDYIEGLHQKITQKRSEGRAFDEDLKEVNAAINKLLARVFGVEQALNEYNAATNVFWEGVRYDIRLKEDAYASSLQYLGETMSRTGQQINNNAQRNYEGLRNLQQNRPINCTTSMGYLGTTAFTSCY